MQALGALIETVQMAGHVINAWPCMGATASGRVLLVATLVGERVGRGFHEKRFTVVTGSGVIRKVLKELR